MDKRFLLLQINDAAFPIGAYTHSFGLETYVQAGRVHDAASAQNYLEQMLRHVFLFGDLLLVRLAWDTTRQIEKVRHPKHDEQSEQDEQFKGSQLLTLDALETLAAASRTPRELREAATKLGSRFEKAALNLGRALPKRERRTYAVSYGEFCALQDIDRTDALSAYIFAQASAQITTCVKAIPLSQSAGQSMLAKLYPLFEELVCQVDTLSVEDLFRSAPGFDIHAMQHEHLYWRLYMS